MHGVSPYTTPEHKRFNPIQGRQTCFCLLLFTQNPRGAGIMLSVKRHATVWMAWGSKRGGGEIFRTHSAQSKGPLSLLYIGHRVSCPVVQ